MVLGFLRFATVGVLMFGGGVLAASVLPKPVTSPGLPLGGTQCGLTAHCGPTAYHPPVVTDAHRVIKPICRIALHPPFTQESIPRIHDADFTSVEAPFTLADATFSTDTLWIDAFLAEADRNAVVLTASASKAPVAVFVLYRCTTHGLAEQFVNVPVDPHRTITLETVRVPQPQRL